MKHIQAPIKVVSRPGCQHLFDANGNALAEFRFSSVHESTRARGEEARLSFAEIALALNLFDRMVDAIQAQWEVDKILLSGRVHVVADTQQELDDYLLRATDARAKRLDILALLGREGR